MDINLTDIQLIMVLMSAVFVIIILQGSWPEDEE